MRERYCRLLLRLSPVQQRNLTAAVSCAEATAFQQLLRGGGRGEMGLDALAARARDLQKSLDQMATGLAVNAHNIGWCAVVVGWSLRLMSEAQQQ